jgi:hypothetical protein
MDIFIYLTLGFLIIFVELKRERYFLIDHLTLFNFFFFLVYSFAPIAIKLIGDEAIADDLIYGKYYMWKNPFTAPIILFSYILFLIGFYWRSPRKLMSKVEFDFRLSYRELFFIVIPIVYIIVIALLLIYIQGNGGLRVAIENSEAFREGVLIPKYASALKLLKINIILLYYFFYKLFLLKDKKNRILSLTYFLISFTIFIINIALINSRGFIILTLFGFYFMTIIYHKRFFINYALIALFFTTLFIKYGDPLFASLPDLVNYDFDTFINSFSHRVAIRDMLDRNIVTNFSHPIVSLETSLALSGSSELDFRYFMDYIYAFLILLPDSIFGYDDSWSISVLNTKILYGEEISQTLPGILAFFSYSLNVVGIFVGMFIYGVIGGVLSELFINIYRRYPGYLVFIFMISLYYGYFVFRGNPATTLRTLIVVIAANIFLLTFSKIYINRKKRLTNG